MPVSTNRITGDPITAADINAVATLANTNETAVGTKADLVGGLVPLAQVPKSQTATASSIVQRRASGAVVVATALVADEALRLDQFPGKFSTEAVTYLPANNYSPSVVIQEGAAIPTGLADGTIVFVIPAASATTPVITELTAGSSTTDGTAFTTASYAPTAGGVLLMHVSTGHATLAAPLPSSFTDSGLTWTLVTNIPSTNTFTRSSLYKAAGTRGTGTTAINFASTVEGIAWRVLHTSNVNTVVQSATATNASLTPSVSLSSVNPANPVLGFFAHQSGSQTITPGTGFTALGAQQTVLTPSIMTSVTYKTAGVNLVDWATSGSAQKVLIAIEVAA